MPTVTWAAHVLLTRFADKHQNGNMEKLRLFGCKLNAKASTEDKEKETTKKWTYTFQEKKGRFHFKTFYYMPWILLNLLFYKGSDEMNKQEEKSQTESKKSVLDIAQLICAIIAILISCISIWWTIKTNNTQP